MTEKSYYNNINTYVNPCIKAEWLEHRKKNIIEIQDRDVRLCGDAQYDSVGHCAQMCTKTLSDVDSNKIIDFVVLMRGMVAGDLEKNSIDILLTRLLQSDMLNITVLLTDRQTSVRCLLKNKYKVSLNF
jgi:hypothetical protein